MTPANALRPLLPLRNGDRTEQTVLAPDFPGADAGVPGALYAGGGRALQADHRGVLCQSRPQRADRRGAPDRHHPVVPAGDPAPSGSGLGEQFPYRRSRAGDRAASEAAGADGGDPWRRALGADDDLAADHAAFAGFDCDAAGRSPRYFPLHDRLAGLSRPARHLLGPDRNRRLRRQGDRRLEGRRRCRAPCSIP